MRIELSKSQKIKTQTPDDLYKVMREILLAQDECRRKQEYFWVIGLNHGLKIEYIELVALGRLNAVHVMPRDIFSYAIEIRCAQIALVHNHPSGNLNPSAEDIFFTERMVQAAAILDMKIVDHLVISEDGFKSCCNEISVIYHEHRHKRAKRPLIFDFCDYPSIGSDQSQKRNEEDGGQ